MTPSCIFTSFFLAPFSNEHKMSEAEQSTGGDDQSASGDELGAEALPTSTFTWFVEDYIRPKAVQILIWAAKNPWDFVYTVILCLAPFFAISAYLAYK